MVIKNGSKLSEAYFESYFKLQMNTLNRTLDEAYEHTQKEFFAGNTDRFGKETYKNFLSAYEKMHLDGK